MHTGFALRWKEVQVQKSTNVLQPLFDLRVTLLKPNNMHPQIHLLLTILLLMYKVVWLFVANKPAVSLAWGEIRFSLSEHSLLALDGLVASRSVDMFNGPCFSSTHAPPLCPFLINWELGGVEHWRRLVPPTLKFNVAFQKPVGNVMLALSTILCSQWTTLITNAITINTQLTVSFIRYHLHHWIKCALTFCSLKS